jgi:hypothetical protein
VMVLAFMVLSVVDIMTVRTRPRIDFSDLLGEYDTSWKVSKKLFSWPNFGQHVWSWESAAGSSVPVLEVRTCISGEPLVHLGRKKRGK